MVVAVVVVARTNDPRAISSIGPSSTPGVAAEIRIGVHSERSEIEIALRTAQGILALFCNLEIDFEEVKIEWEPETDEERSKIKLHSFSRSTKKPDQNTPRALDYDLIGRAVAAAAQATEYEVPLSFLRKANRDLIAGRYIEAFYNYFFFLETQFAPGYSNPKRVKERLEESPEIIRALKQARLSIEADERRDPNTALHIKKLSDSEVIELLVKLRGTLHHHAKDRLGAWHPDKPEAFRTHTLLIAEICQATALDQLIPILYAEEQKNSISRSAEKAGATVDFVFKAIDCDGRSLPDITIPIIGRNATSRMVHTADKIYREIANHQYRRYVDLRSYKVTSTDGGAIYAEYNREN